MFIVLLFCVIKALKMLKHLLLRVCVCVCDFTDSGSSFHKRTLKFYTKEWDCSCLRQWWQSCTQAAHSNRQEPHTHTRKKDMWIANDPHDGREIILTPQISDTAVISAQTSKIKWHRCTVTEQFKNDNSGDRNKNANNNTLLLSIPAMCHLWSIVKEEGNRLQRKEEKQTRDSITAWRYEFSQATWNG